MKLLLCRECTDVKAITQHRRLCSCRKSFARYVKETGKVRYGGPAVILGLPNEDMEILIGPPEDSTKYVVHKIIVVDPIVGRKPATTVEYVG